MQVVVEGHFTPVWYLPLPSVCLRFIDMYKCLPAYEFSAFLHINVVPSVCVVYIILIRYRLINERLPYIIGTIGLPALYPPAHLIGSFRIYYVFKIKAGRFRKRCLFLQSLC